MKYAIVVSSKTGNTKMLAREIEKQLKNKDCIYCGEPADLALKADIIFVGFWTDKGTCSDEVQLFLEKCRDKKVFLFGTAGFGGEQSYFTHIIENVRKYLPESATEMGSFMCQGKMPESVRVRYEQITDIPQEKKQAMLDNFDRALTHPSKEDLEKLIEHIAKVIA